MPKTRAVELQLGMMLFKYLKNVLLYRLSPAKAINIMKCSVRE